MAAIAVILYIAFVVFLIYCQVRIVQRAGYSGWWVAITLVPIVGIVMMFVFAYSNKWPVLQKRGVNPNVFN
jgi:uncharacterized membrane protein YhaH (DUF805 family)